MRRVEDLLAELCPNGVVFRAMGEVTEVRSGWGFPHTEQGSPDGAFPFYKVSDMNAPGNGLVMDRAKNYVSQESIARLGASPAPPGTVVFPKIGAAVATNKKRLLSVSSAYDNNVMGIIPSSSLIPRYLLYWMQTINLSRIANDSGAVPSIRKSDIEQVRVPVPPIEVQREIVKILDTFTSLEAELEAELQGRRRQYDYYRESLFAFAETEEVRWMTMGDLGTFTRGRRFTKNDVVPDGIGSIHYGEIYTRYGTSATEAVSRVRPELAPTLRFAQTGDVVIAAVGETVEDVCKAVAWLGEEHVAVHDDCFIFRHSMNPTFVSYYFQTSSFHAEKAKHVARAKVKRVSGESLERLKIPVPPIDEQERIVAILDKLDALVNDLSIGLPAELKARRQQYEHYRDRLLTFSEAA